MEPRKQAIMAALDKFVAQRPGLEFGNYGDMSAYRSEMRSITRDRHDYNALARAVERSDSITADMLLEAARSAYSGRLSVEFTEFEGQDPRGNPKALLHVCRHCGQSQSAHTPGTAPQDPWGCPGNRVRIDYVTGQYFPTEYRKAACAALASVLRYHVRENCMPPVGTAPCGSGKAEAGMYFDGKRSVSADDWLCTHFRKEFGRSIASRWFR